MNWQDFFGCEFPIIQAPMTHNGSFELAAAISEAGGFGTIMTNGDYSASWLDHQIKMMKKNTSQPFAVSIFQRPWFSERKFLTKMKDKKPTADESLIFDGIEAGKKLVEEQLQVCLDHKITHAYLHGDRPHPKNVTQLKSINCKIMAKCFFPEQVPQLLKLGTDAIFLKGREAAGYVGYKPIIEMIKETVNKGLPVISSGGIYSSQQVKEHLDLGVLAVMLGTRFVCAKESPVHPNFKNEVFRSSSEQVKVSKGQCKTAFVPTRAIVNETTGKWLREHDKIFEKYSCGEISYSEAQKLLKRLPCVQNPHAGWSEDLHGALVLGDVVNGPVMVGTGIDTINKEESVQDIIKNLTTELALR